MKAHRLAGLLVCALGCASACGESIPVGPVGLNEQFTLAPGGSASISGASMHVMFLGVSGDSRCPADVVCMQGGDAVVHVRVTNRTTSEHELHTGDQARASAVHGEFRITLEQLQPYPFSSRAIAPGDYRATLRVARR